MHTTVKRTVFIAGFLFWYMLIYSANSCYFTSAKQQVKQLGSDVLSGRNLLSRKQMKTGSLANLIPRSELEVSEMREITPIICEYLCLLQKKILQTMLSKRHRMKLLFTYSSIDILNNGLVLMLNMVIFFIIVFISPSKE